MARPKTGYRLADGTRVVGVTTVLGRFKESGALLHWAFAQGRLAEQGIIQHLYDKRNEAADIGTAAHEMTEAYLHGADPEYALASLIQDEAMRTKSRQAFEMFLRWWEQTNLKIYRMEIPLVSEQHRFGGTPDWILETPQGLAVGDIKTSKGIYSDYLIQVAAYKGLWEENYPDKPITQGFHICRFSKEFPDFAHAYFGELDDAWEQFLRFRAAYDTDKILKKRAA